MCIKYFFAHPPSPGSTFVSSLLSPPFPSPTITYSIFLELAYIYPFGSSPTPTNKVSVPKSPNSIFTAIHKIIRIPCPKCVLLSSQRKREKKRLQIHGAGEREKKQTSKGIILSNNCIIIIIVSAAQLSQLLLRSPPDPESRILNQTRSSHSPQLLLRDRD